MSTPPPLFHVLCFSPSVSHPCEERGELSDPLPYIHRKHANHEYPPALLFDTPLPSCLMSTPPCRSLIRSSCYHLCEERGELFDSSEDRSHQPRHRRPEG